MPTVHNPTNFKPEDYEILGYIDNQPPKAFWGQTLEHREAELSYWRREMESLFPARNAYRCQHCGQGNVRYVCAAKHRSTGEHVCFGDICVARLGFPNHDAFRAKMIRTKASRAAERAALEAKARKFAADNGLDVEALVKDPHKGNYFIQSVIAKLFQYGSMSPRQVEAVKASAAKDHQWAAEQAARTAGKPVAPAPEGQQTVRGKVVSLKWKDDGFGYHSGSWKMLVALDSGARVYGTCPVIPDAEIVRDSVVEFTATFERSKDDTSFGFFKRPRKASLVVEAVAGK